MDHNLFEKVPSSVYRLQLNEEFPLKEAIKILPYLHKLGIDGVYLSPLFEAYSPHGYDVTDPNRLNPKIGTEKEYTRFCGELKKWGLKQILDVVPNHMGIKGGGNHYWQDVLENGPYSPYASFFDIEWECEKKELKNRVLYPILGSHYGKALESHEIVLHFSKGAFTLFYHDTPLPVSSDSYPILLKICREFIGEKDPNLVEFYETFPHEPKLRSSKKQEGEARLEALFTKTKKGEKVLENLLCQTNGKKRLPSSFDLLDSLLEAQFYRLSYWKVANHEINYRRFFNIHELAALRIEDEAVLQEHHRWLFSLMEKGVVDGLRIDHPDGLYDPDSYFSSLQTHGPIYTVVEKILDRKEKLPDSWRVDGTVGYEYLNILNGIFIRQQNEKAFTDIYEEFIGQSLDFETLVYESKKLFASYEMVSEVEALGRKLDRVSEETRHYRDFTRHDLTQAIEEVIAYFPVYRTYNRPFGKANRRDARYITIAIQKAKAKAPSLDHSLFDFLENLLLGKLPKAKEAGFSDFVLSFQQLTGPMMAKGLEDTTFYRYNRLLSLNEVGGDPPHFGYSEGEFHRLFREKQEKWPYGFLASSTHDTKRSEDVRMRLNVLSEIPERWRLEVKRWSLLNSRFKGEGPSLNTEYFLYQTLLGVWPKEGVRKKEREAFFKRLWEVVVKSMREAKQETSWMEPNLEYEEDVRRFLESILTPQIGKAFLTSFLPFVHEIDRLGARNSLSATALKIALPGVVDVYQGNELFHYRLVDPDNRAPVDFTSRKKLLAQGNKEFKLFLHQKALNCRREHKELFIHGEYIPLRVRGFRKDHLIAFLRKTKEKTLLVVVSRFFASLPTDEPLGKKTWKETEVLLPAEYLSKVFEDVFTQKKLKAKKQGGQATLSVAELLETYTFSYCIT
ncbi:MAG: Maltooligosyl trehalose synthase [Chlamydiae bacterium]|nr:Maltooligosyl trehalose synthase [Chlamydiota bacterium]